MRHSKKLAALAIVAGVAITASAAFAYWTTTGSGGGSATAASSNGTIVLTASFDPGIFPGGSKVVTFDAANAGASNLYVGTVHLVSVDAEEALGVTGQCDVTDFSMADVVQNQMIEPGNEALANPGSLVFANSAANQDNCKGAQISLRLSSN
jgi:hypothetical protein